MDFYRLCCENVLCCTLSEVLWESQWDHLLHVNLASRACVRLTVFLVSSDFGNEGKKKFNILFFQVTNMYFGRLNIFKAVNVERLKMLI